MSQTPRPTVYGQAIRRHLEQRGWSQLELARRTGLGPQAINKMVQGRTHPRTQSLEVIAEAFGMTVIDLLGEGEPATNGAA